MVGLFVALIYPLMWYKFDINSDGKQDEFEWAGWDPEGTTSHSDV